MSLLKNKAVLVDLDIGTYIPIKKDRKLTNKIIDENGAVRKAASVNKNKFPGGEFDKITSFGQKIRNEHYSLTHPWIDDSYRLLENKDVFTYKAFFHKVEPIFWGMVDETLKNLDSIIEAQKPHLKHLFTYEDYPSNLASIIRSDYKLRAKFLPVPDASSFIERAGEEELNRLVKESTESALEEAEETIRLGFKDKISKPITKLLEMITKEDVKLHQSLVENTLKAVDDVLTSTLLQDPQLEFLCKEISTRLDGYNMKEIKKDDVLKNGLITEVNDIMHQLANYV